MKSLRPSTRLTFIVFVTLVVLCVGLIVAFLWSQSERIKDTSARNDHLLNVLAEKDRAYNDLLDKYTILSGDCKAAADCDTVTPDPSDIPSAEPVSGKPGETGATGPRGERGLTGDMGVPGAAGPVGAAGIPGSPGKDGADGTTGASGPAGPSGPAGADGAPGAPGAPGAEGPAGQPPLSWTFTDALGIPYQCTRTDPFDPTQPTYTCAAVGTGP